jgi:hypothetical protein
MLDQLKSELDQIGLSGEAVEVNMTSLLNFPPRLRQLITWIMRQKVVQVAGVAQFLEISERETQVLMDRMVKKKLIEEEQSADGAHYLVPVHSTRNYRVPERVWKALDE